MRTRVLGSVAAIALLLAHAACGSSTFDCTQNATCTAFADGGGVLPEGSVGADAGDSGSSGGEGGTADGGDGGPVTPPNCDETADPTSAEAAGCIDDTFAVFVSAGTGSDTAKGTKLAPLKSIGAALTTAAAAGKRHVYLCDAAPFPESVKLTSAINIHGGFACATWQPDKTKASVAPPAPGVALQIEGASLGITISDVDVKAQSAGAEGDSSVAAFVQSSKVKFVRVALTAGDGKKGKDGAQGGGGTLMSVAGSGGVEMPPLSAKGYAAMGAGPGSFKDCTCENAAKTTGGSGAPAGLDGAPGEPAIPTKPGGGGGSKSLGCSSGGGGATGSAGPAAGAAVAVMKLGTLSVVGWQPGAGANGPEFGGIGQGGGGGTGKGVTAGGGGGCGGCGGAPGMGGGGGGGSIALLSVASEVTFIGSRLASGAGGIGGKGGAGGVGGTGGSGGAGASDVNTNGCLGGDGGQGGSGSPAGGGPGGVSYAILYAGTVPVLDPDTGTNGITLGKAGVGGTGGKPGAAPAGNDGPKGKSDVMAEASSLSSN